MKRNAIFRICAYVGLILLLIAILCVGIFGMHPWLSIGLREDFVMATMSPMSEAAVPVTMPVEERQVLATGRTLFDLDVYASPTSGSLCSGRMIKGVSVNILEIRTTNGEDWAYVDGSAQGWVQLPLLEVDGYAPVETVTVETSVLETASEEHSVLSSSNAAVLETLNVRDTPSKDGEVVALLDAGSRVQILQIQNAMGTTWAYVSWDGNFGWVCLDYLELDSKQDPPETTITLLEEGEPGLRKFHQPIASLDITWPSGKVVVEAGDVQTLEVRAEDGTAQCSISDKGRLKIEAVSRLLSFKKKDLTILLPRDFELEKLELDIASAYVEIRNLAGQLNEVELDTASGSCTLENLNIRELDIDTASGQVAFTGRLERLNFDSASAPLSAVFLNHPQKIDLETSSGNISLGLPKDCGFTAVLRKGGKVTTNFDISTSGSSQVFGDGACKIDLETQSGKLDIRKSDQ